MVEFLPMFFMQQCVSVIFFICYFNCVFVGIFMCLMPYLWFGEINISLFAYFLSDVDLHVLSRSPFFLVLLLLMFMLLLIFMFDDFTVFAYFGIIIYFVFCGSDFSMFADFVFVCYFLCSIIYLYLGRYFFLYFPILVWFGWNGISLFDDFLYAYGFSVFC